MVNHLQSRKGQSAIEYLTTYGWMLLVVAIVGAAIFTTISNTDGAQANIEGFGDDISVEEVQVNTDDNLVMSIRNNAAPNGVDIHNVTISSDGNTAYNDTGISLPGDVDETRTFTMQDVNSSDTGDTFDVDFTYSTDQFPDSNLTENGTIEGEYQITS
jgi:hypothetical protein